ncbi:MAG: alpha/beta fold hydrolase [Deltaproteobacteria bacterium]|nr:alpha/beta fold hydrolase [Deltaproteobacteria bacterium]
MRVVSLIASGTEIVHSNPFLETFRWADRCRRWIGELLELAGPARSEAAHEVLFRDHPLSLRRYGEFETGAPVLLVPAPIKRGYLWDLLPEVSVVRRLLAHRLRVYLAYWEDPDAEGAHLGLEAYTDALLRCASTASRDCGGVPPVLIGHSLGGTLAVVAAALEPSAAARLVLLGAPIDFASRTGIIGFLAAPGQNSCATLPDGNTPGSLLGTASFAADPVAFGLSRYLDGLSSMADPLRLRTHLAVERWALDELPLPGRLLRDLLDLIRENRFMTGSLSLRGRTVGPDAIQMPVLAVLDRQDTVATPETVVPFLRELRSPENRLLWFSGETGTSLRHVGPLVGPGAHALLWPRIIDWLGEPERMEIAVEVATGAPCRPQSEV